MPNEILLDSSIGSITSTDLESCTATESDVLIGKTFYSGNDTIKTGTASLLVYIGVFGGHRTANISSATFDVKSKLPDLYSKLTSSNFLVANTTIFTTRASSSDYDTFGIRVSYNASTGTLTCRNDSGSTTYSASVYCKIDSVL